MEGIGVANIITALRKEGWSDEKILDFIVFISTHDPREEAAEKN